LTLQFARIEAGIGEDVGKDIDGERHVVGKYTREEGGRLHAGRCIDLAADVLDLRSDVPGGTLPGPLEGHVFEEVGYAVLLVPFVSRPRLDPDAERNGFDGRNGFGRNRQ